MAPSTALPLHHRTTNPYESLFGYSRAVRKGPFIFVSGTTAVELPPSSDASFSSTPTIKHPTSAYDQALCTFQEIIKSVEALGGTPSDVVRVRMYVTYEGDSGKVARALKEIGGTTGLGGEGGPAATLLVGVKFVHPDMRVEIEADAVVL